MDETNPSEAAAENSPTSTRAIEIPIVALPLREPSPLRPLLIRLGPVFAITNLGLFPSFCGMAAIIIASIFGGSSPWSDWLPLLIALTLFLVGLVAAQAFLVTLCFTWSQGGYWRRFCHHWLVVLAIAATLLGGSLIMVFGFGMLRVSETGPWYGSEEQVAKNVMGILAALASLPMVLLAVQLPFWLARHFFGCRLINARHATTHNFAPPRESLALRDLFGGTALVAVSLGLLQFADRVNVANGEPERAHLFANLIFAVTSAGVASILALPLTVLFFRCRSLGFAWGVALAAAGIDSLVMFAISESINRTPNPWESLVLYFGLFYSFTCGAAAGLTILRRHEWCMVNRWSAAHD